MTRIKQTNLSHLLLALQQLVQLRRTLEAVLLRLFLRLLVIETLPRLRNLTVNILLCSLGRRNHRRLLNLANRVLVCYITHNLLHMNRKKQTNLGDLLLALQQLVQLRRTLLSLRIIPQVHPKQKQASHSQHQSSWASAAAPHLPKQLLPEDRCRKRDQRWVAGPPPPSHRHYD